MGTSDGLGLAGPLSVPARLQKTRTAFCQFMIYRVEG